MSTQTLGALALLASLLLAGCSDWTTEVDGNYPEPYREPVEQDSEPPPDYSEPPWLQEQQDPRNGVPERVEGGSGTACQDVTSYDHDWNNDMLCTRPDGSQFYTDYAGAAEYQ